jgi:hypothetical protein
VSIGTGTGAVQHQQEPTLEKSPRPGKRWKLTLVALAGVYVTLACYSLIANSSQLKSNAASAATSVPRSPSPTVSAASAAPRRAKAGSGPAPALRESTAKRPASHLLNVVSITAFGPEGTADGDNPGIASRILDDTTNQPWYSQWYATPDFGGLRQGTGLLIELDDPATVTNVSVALGSTPGTDIQVRIGDSPSLALPTVASAWDVGGNVDLTPSPRNQGSYVLLWFTRLPFIGQGHYQVNVYNVTVDGINQR